MVCRLHFFKNLKVLNKNNDSLGYARIGALVFFELYRYEVISHHTHILML